LKIVGRKDVNGDGIEDLEVCFVDQALNGGTYNTSKGCWLRATPQTAMRLP